MRRNLHYLWPRAESNIYAEPKRLVEGGFAEVRSLPQGNRPRTVYSITREGRKALEQWLGKPGDSSRLESEALVKLMFATDGSKRDLLTTLRRFRDDAEGKRTELAGIFGEYLNGEDPFPERVHINVVAYRLLWAYAQTEVTWASWALDQVRRWPNTKKSSGRPELMAALRAALGEGPNQRRASSVQKQV
jgi:DNA-binding PadR family transcriptional regulator